MPLSNKERDRILEQYAHTIEEFDDEKKLLASEKVRKYEDDYAYDPILAEWMRKTKERKVRFLRQMAGKEN